MNIEQTGQDFAWPLQTEGPRVGGRGSKIIGVKVSEIRVLNSVLAVRLTPLNRFLSKV